MDLVQVLNELRLYFQTCLKPKYEIHEGARAPSAPPPVAPLDRINISIDLRRFLTSFLLEILFSRTEIELHYIQTMMNMEGVLDISGCKDAEHEEEEEVEGCPGQGEKKSQMDHRRIR